jgi:hypothetical protein
MKYTDRLSKSQEKVEAGWKAFFQRYGISEKAERTSIEEAKRTYMEEAKKPSIEEAKNPSIEEAKSNSIEEASRTSSADTVTELVRVEAPIVAGPSSRSQPSKGRSPVYSKSHFLSLNVFLNNYFNIVVF